VARRLSLLEAVGSVEERHDGKYLVHVGTETEVVRMKNKDIDVNRSSTSAAC
jgi:hypothetical protein